MARIKRYKINETPGAQFPTLTYEDKVWRNESQAFLSKLKDVMKSPFSEPLKPVLRIDFPDVERLGRGKIMLLELIIETGSISSAGRAMDMSYRRAWLLVDALNQMFSTPVVESRHGGKHGGGAAVTDFGVELIACFRSMEQKISVALSDDLEWLQKNRTTVSEVTSG